MKIYRISTQKAKAERSKALKRTAFIMSAALFIGFLIGGRSFFQQRDPVVLLVWVGFVAVIVVLVVWAALHRTSRFLADAYSTFEIISDGQAWIKRQKNTPDVSIAKSEVRRVEELQGKGFRVSTGDRHKNIWVPCELDDYNELRSEVLALPGVAMTSKSAAWLRTYLAIAVLMLLVAISVLAADKRVAAVASVSVGVYFVWAFFKHYRNPNLSVKGKRQFVLGAFIGICMLLRAIFIWRA